MNLLKHFEPLFEFAILNTYLFLQINGESYQCDLVFVQVHFPVLHLLNYLKIFHPTVLIFQFFQTDYFRLILKLFRFLDYLNSYK